MSKHADDFISHIRLCIDAFAELANSERMDDYCEKCKQDILDTLEAYQFAEAEFGDIGDKKPEDVIGEEFKRFIQGS